MKEELEGMRRRMEQHAEEMSSKMAAEREIVRQENKQERDDLNNKVGEAKYIRSLKILSNFFQ